ncbi:MAG: hypothetical protein ACJ72E_15270 [Marmoricola sp.]
MTAAVAVPPVYHVDTQSSADGPISGSGEVAGNLEFTGKFKFNYDLSVADLCPADGFGTGFYFVSEMGDGAEAMSAVRGHNNDGCGTGWKNWTATLQTQRMIKRTRVAICWTDDNYQCALTSTSLSTWKDNPTW